MSQARVIILDTNFPNNDIERRVISQSGAELTIAQCRSEEQVIEQAADVDAIIVQYAPLSRRSIGGLRQCKIISRYGIGTDNIDIPAATDNGIWVANVPGFCAPEVSDHTLAMILACARRLFPLDRSVREGGWDVIGVAGPTLRVSESTVGIIGFGAIARELSRKASALGMRVLAHSPRSADQYAAQYGAQSVDLETLVRESDYITLLCPLTPETRQVINRERLGWMKKTSFLINNSRGPLVDEAALVDALKSGQIAGAALDVFEKEPPAMDNPLRQLPNVIVSPHGAFYSSRSLSELQERTAGNVVDFLAGKRPGSLLNNPPNPRVAL